MKRIYSKEFKKIRDDRIQNVGRCELCGSTQALELHHIIPVMFGGEDSEDNLLLVCTGCHARLTPKQTLIKLAMNTPRYTYKDMVHYVVSCCWSEYSNGKMLDIFSYLNDDNAMCKELLNKELPMQEQKEMKRAINSLMEIINLWGESNEQTL